MKKTTLANIAISTLLISLAVSICSYQVMADSADSVNFLDSALTIYSPVNMTYNYRHLTLDLTVPVWSIMGMPNNVSMNYTVDGIFSGSVPLRDITPSDAPPIATKVGMGSGIVDLPEFPDGSHYLTIYLYGLNMLNYQPQFKSYVYTIYFSIDDPNSNFTPITTPTPTSYPNPSLTASPFSPRVQERFVISNTLYAFQGSKFLCSFNATAGSWVELNMTLSGDNSFVTIFEVTSNNHGSISNSTVYGNVGVSNYTQKVYFNYDDTFNITVAKHPFFSTVTIKGTIDLYRIEPIDTPAPPTNLPLPSSTLQPSPSVPEFPCWIILGLFLATTMLTVVFFKNKIAKKPH
jgi:hypothetical protein